MVLEAIAQTPGGPKTQISLGLSSGRNAVDGN